jgi:lysophospholipase L1-like esterase
MLCSAFAAVRNAITLAAAVGAAILVIFGIEALASLHLYSTRQNAGLIWAPDSTVEHATNEFHYVARINNLGFRDRDFSRSKSDTRRIAVLGDSFTYGWGLSIEESWPKVLETRLRELGQHVEVANLGVPGAGPREYANLAPRALQVLHPDVVIVAVVQADDLFQRRESGDSTDSNWRARLRSALDRLFPSLAQLAGLTHPNRLHVSSQMLRETWKTQVQTFLGGLNSADHARYNLLPSRIRDLYAEGDLNPGLLYYSIRHPAFMMETCQLDRLSTRQEISELTRRLGEVRDVAKRYGARALVVSVPYRTYVSARDLDAMQTLGFTVEPAMLQTEAPDEAIRKAARHAGLTFVQVTDSLRRQATATELYFPLDGHFNSRGARAFAMLLAAEIAALP